MFIRKGFVIRRGWVVGAATLGVLLGAAGPAAGEPETETDARARAQRTKDSAKAPAEAPKTGAPANAAAPKSGKGEAGEAQTTGAWSIVLAVFRGEEQQSEAQAMLARVRSEGQLPGAVLQRRGPAMVIAIGSFADADDAKAQTELKRVQAIVVGGEKPYVTAYLAPPAQGSMPGSIPQYNLVRARELFGDKAVQTLQVAVYGRLDLDRATPEDLAEARKAAEQAAFRLRQEGEQAYYYHGRRMSMVTVGVFDLSDFDPLTPSYKSPSLRDAQKRHPYNLYNGQAIKQKVKGQAERLQPSTLVAIPKS